jgi:hypothetical protein
VTADVGDEGKKASSLDRRRQLTLMTRARAAQPRRQNLSLIGNEASERAVVLIVDPPNAALAEWAAFLWSSHCWLILVVVIVVTARCRGQVFLGLRRSTHFVLVQRDEVADDTIVEAERLERAS